MLIDIVDQAGGNTHLKVSVLHASKRLIVDVTPIKREASGVTSFRLCSGKSRTVEAMPRLNRKRIAALERQVAAEVAARVGPTWDLIQLVVRDCGLELVVPTSPPIGSPRA